MEESISYENTFYEDGEVRRGSVLLRLTLLLYTTRKAHPIPETLRTVLAVLILGKSQTCPTVQGEVLRQKGGRLLDYVL